MHQVSVREQAMQNLPHSPWNAQQAHQNGQ